MKRLTFLEFLIFRLGGVSGCTRRLVFQKKGLFTANEIRAELALKYPRLVPAVSISPGAPATIKVRFF